MQGASLPGSERRWVGSPSRAPTLCGRPGPRAHWVWAPAGSRHRGPGRRPWPERIPASSTSSSRPGADRGGMGLGSPSGGPAASPVTQASPPRKPPTTEPGVGESCLFPTHEPCPTSPRPEFVIQQSVSQGGTQRGPGSARGHRLLRGKIHCPALHTQDASRTVKRL